MTRAATYDLAIDQGATEAIKVWIKNVAADGSKSAEDLTGYVARMQIRRRVDDDAVLDSLTTENGRITIDGPNGLVTLNFPDATTAAFTFTRGVYDLELISPGSVVRRRLRGMVLVSPEVTR